MAKSTKKYGVEAYTYTPRSRRVERCTEKAVHNNLVKSVHEAGGLIFKNHPMTSAGIPDVIIHMPNGKTLYVEEKGTGLECTALQIHFHHVLKERGIETFVLDTKIDNFYDLYLYAYTEYESKYYDRNPHKEKHKQFIPLKNQTNEDSND